MIDTWNEIFNACADTHPKRREFYLKEVAKQGQSTIVFNEQSKNDYNIINSQKMKDLLGYEFRYPDIMNYE